MNAEPDYYILLGITSDATEAQIRVAFSSEIKKHHPDTTQTDNNERARHLLKAREILTDPVQREIYDAQRSLISLIPNSSRGPSKWIFVCSQGMGQFRTIAEALDAARTGDKIYVLPGTYRETVIEIDKSIEIAGQGTEDDPVIIESQNDILYLPAHGATIRGISFRTLSRGRIAVRANSPAGTISDCKFSTPDGTGLLIEGNSHLTIEGCSFENCKLGIRIENSNPTIVASRFSNNTTGLLVRENCECIIENNEFSDNNGSSIEVQENTSVRILKNKLKGGVVGVVVGRTSRGIISNNSFPDHPEQTAIHLRDGKTELTVENNRFQPSL